MKNCPMFSLRSNSIESRFRSILGGNFLLNFVVAWIKSKSSIVRALLDALILNHVSKGETVIREKSRRNFNDVSSLVDTRSMKLGDIPKSVAT